MTIKSQPIDRDAITRDPTHVRDAGGGSLYRLGGFDMVVLNGTYAEMGRQYGDLVKDKLLGARDGWRKIFVDSGKLSYDSILAVIGKPFYLSATKTQKDFYGATAQASGLSVDEVVVLDNWLPLTLLGRRAGCSSLVAWGAKTSDGTAYMGRNLDFPEFVRDMFAAYGVMTITNPVGGDYGVAGVGVAGTVSGFDDAINSEGLYVEYNNGIGSIEPVLYSNRFALPTYMCESLRKYSTIEELRVVFNTMKSDYPCIMGVCQRDMGVHFEISPETYVAEVAAEEKSLRANQFHSPSWGIPQLPGATGWYSKPREEAWHKALAAANASKFDEKVFMEVMNQPMWTADGALTGTGFSVFEPSNDPSAGHGGESGDVTMYQSIVHPAEGKWWLRIPTHTGWMEFNLKTYFRQPS